MLYAQVLKTAMKGKTTSHNQSTSVIAKVRDVAPNKESSMSAHKHIHSVNILAKNKVRTGYQSSTANPKKCQAKVSHQHSYPTHIHCENRFAVLPVGAVICDTVSAEDEHSVGIGKAHSKVPCRRNVFNTRVTKGTKASSYDAVDKSPLALPPVKEGEVDVCNKYDLPLRIKNK